MSLLIFLQDFGKTILAGSIYISLVSLPPLLLIYCFDKSEDGGGAGAFGWLLFKFFKSLKNGKT